MSLRNPGFYRWSSLETTGTQPPPMVGMSLNIYVTPQGVQVT